jgi:Kef-type K+ transport system membrane component KefB
MDFSRLLGSARNPAQRHGRRLLGCPFGFRVGQEVARQVEGVGKDCRDDRTPDHRPDQGRILTPIGLYGNRPSELETKFLLFCLLGMGALAGWADSEAVLPAYLIGMVLAGTVGKDHALIRRLRTLTFGLLTPFYFIRAGSFVSIPALLAAPAAFLCFLVVKIAAKIIGVYPVTKWFGSPAKEAMYTTLLMSTGLTFGTISSLFGLSHGIRRSEA